VVEFTAEWSFRAWEANEAATMYDGA
jgi:hypothetical protein